MNSLTFVCKADAYATPACFIQLTVQGPMIATWIRISMKVITANLTGYSVNQTKCSIMPPSTLRC